GDGPGHRPGSPADPLQDGLRPPGGGAPPDRARHPAKPPPHAGDVRPDRRAAAGGRRSRRCRRRRRPHRRGRRVSPAAAIPPPRPAPHRARGAGHPRPPAPRAGASPAVWLAAAGVLVLLYFFRGLLLPLLLAAGLAYLLNPLIAW